jgi:flagellum-specific peptidoglycan hydrolase FlgJ
MIKRLPVLLLLACFLIGCKVKKTTTYGKKKTQKTAQSETTKADDGGIYVLPEDTGRFVRFEINSITEYVQTFSKVAQFEMKAYGIPASITLAQGLLESGFGKGELARKTNNHFGIKCHKGWEGDYDFHDDDEKGECFRKYNHPMYSYRDHSLFLKNRSRYASLFELRKNDYKKWAYGLKKAGYATDKRYPNKLISLIEKYELHKYDELVLGSDYMNVSEPAKEVVEVKEQVSTHVVKKGDTLYSISKKYSVSVDDLKRWNYLYDNLISEGQTLIVNTESFNN